MQTLALHYSALLDLTIHDKSDNRDEHKDSAALMDISERAAAGLPGRHIDDPDA